MCVPQTAPGNGETESPQSVHNSLSMDNLLTVTGPREAEDLLTLAFLHGPWPIF